MEYGQFCPVAKALEVLGERWTILIVRELLMGDVLQKLWELVAPRAFSFNPVIVVGYYKLCSAILQNWKHSYQSAIAKI